MKKHLWIDWDKKQWGVLNVKTGFQDIVGFIDMGLDPIWEKKELKELNLFQKIVRYFYD